jgi:hypothetical protein
MVRTLRFKFISALLMMLLVVPVASWAADEKPVSELKGLILLRSEEAILKEGDPGLAVTGLQVKDIAALAGKDFEKVMQPFLPSQRVPAG